MRAASTSQPPRLIELLFGAYRRRILGLLLLHPEQSFYVREIMRLAGVPSGSLHRELTSLTAAGLLTRSVSGSQVRYQADRSCPLFEELAGIFRKTTGLADVLREALEPLGESVRTAFVFGSIAQGTERGTSDVDVMVLGAVRFERVVEALMPVGERLRREINPVVMTPDEFRAQLKARDRFVSRVAREPKLFIKGDAGELGEPAQDRATQGASR
ncbi:MAG TPA: nucleotidyltransferase domain-containing protein [Coriobacteriia bacterium]|nr:nucleotidyltransferase domain-containing protein [Coriobacteriia bacterium]